MCVEVVELPAVGLTYIYLEEHLILPETGGTLIYSEYPFLGYKFSTLKFNEKNT